MHRPGRAWQRLRQKPGWNFACLYQQRGRAFYRANQGQLEIRQHSGLYQPAILPEGAFRLQMARQAMQPILSTHAASLCAEGLRWWNFIPRPMR